MQPEWVIFGFAAAMALGWSLVNGVHRRSSVNKERLAASISQFPVSTKRKLQRLLAPTSFKDRWNHATVIAGCVCIICTPVAIFAPIVSSIDWWLSPLAVIGGSLVGAYLGEAVFNSWGCGLELPDEANPPPSTGADAPLG
jgi:hypothetical protein